MQLDYIGLYDAFESVTSCMLTCKICAGIENMFFVVIYELFIELQEGNGRKVHFKLS